MRRLAPLAASVLLLVLVSAPGAAPTPPPGAPPEDEILRQIKSDVFEERWEAVLRGCDQLIEAYPKSSMLARTMYYRAKALQNVGGRLEEALEAYGGFVQTFPNETLLREDAVISRMSLAKTLWLRGRKEPIRILIEGLEEQGYPRIYAAIQISHLDHRPARARALPILQDCSQNARDAEVRNECTLAILRIEPGAVPTPPRAQEAPQPPASPGGPGEPKLIRLEVRSKETGKVEVAVNLPIAFAEALLSSLAELDLEGQVTEELRKRQIDINNMWKSLRTLGRQTLVQIETEEQSIKIWLE